MSRIHRPFRLALAVALSLSFASAWAQTAAPTQGTWSGAMTSSKPTVIRVDVTFVPNGINLHFDEPANCRQTATYRNTDAIGTVYMLKPAINGGAFCDRLYPGSVRISTTSPTALKFVIPAPASGGVTWSADLSAHPKP